MTGEQGATGVVVAAGTGSRLAPALGPGAPRKALIELAGRSLVVWSTWALARTPGVDEVVVVLHGDDLQAVEPAPGLKVFGKQARASRDEGGTHH